MNEIKKFYSSITDEDLKKVIIEMKESDKTGYIGDIVRGYAIEISKITGNNTSTELFQTQFFFIKKSGF